MTKREGEGDNEPRCVKCGQPLVTWEQHHVADDCQQWRDADAQIREITERNVRDFRYPSSQSDSDKPKVGPLDMDRINTIGVGIARCSWQAGKVYWWAWTPDGIFTGWADSEEEAKRMGAEAQQAIGTIPKGQGMTPFWPRLQRVAGGIGGLRKTAASGPRRMCPLAGSFQCPRSSVRIERRPSKPDSAPFGPCWRSVELVASSTQTPATLRFDVLSLRVLWWGTVSVELAGISAGRP